ncbi:hypothetical protein V2J09_017959 [Rumex salicifolius]
MPKSLRPINVSRINDEEARISSLARTSEGIYASPCNDISSPPPVPMYLVSTTSENKVVGLSSGNPSSAIVQAPSVPVSSGALMTQPVGKPLAAQSVRTQTPSFADQTCSFTNQVAGDGWEDSMSGKKVKLLCSFGGKILPRPSDGILRYVGGQTRIISVSRDVSFSELVQKMVDAYGQPMVMKYQLPDEDLDALVSISCSDDLENMMEEYEKLLERLSDGSIKLRVFMFTASELDSSSMMQFADLQDSSQKYVDAVNGVMDVVEVGIATKESIASATSTQNSDISVADANDQSFFLGQDMSSINAQSPRSDSTNMALTSILLDFNLPNLSQHENLFERTMPFHVQHTTSGYDLQQTTTKVTTNPTSYLQGLMDAPQDTINTKEYKKVPCHLVYTNSAQVVSTSRPLLLQPQHHDNVTNTVVPQSFIPAVHATMAPTSSSMNINPTMLSQLMESQHLVTIPDQGFNAYKTQVPSGVAGYVPLSVPYQHVTMHENDKKKDDCTMCLKQLPHAHSDTVVQEQRFGTIPDVNTIYQSLQLDDITRLHPVNMIVSPQPELIEASKNQKAQHEDRRIAAEHPGILGPQGVMGLTSDVQTANKPITCESIVRAPLIITDFMSHEVEKDQPRKDDIVDQHSQPVVPNKDQLANNAYSTHTMILEGHEVHRMVSPNDLELVFANRTIQSLMDASNLGGNPQEYVNSLFSNNDPWSFLQDSHLPPPIPCKIVTRKEVFAPVDPLLDNTWSKDAEPMQGHITDPIIHSNMKDKSGQVLCNKVSPDLIKLELQETTEEGTTSILQPTLTSTDIFAPDANHERNIQNNIEAVLQAKLEGMDVKPEKANLAVPRSDGLGRLQIIKNNDLEELRELGSGTFGIVYHGKWRGTDVAIKRINNRCFAGKPSEQERMIDDFWNEAIKLAALHHPNVVAFYGIVLDGPGGSVATVTEYMVNGSLRTALQKNERILDKRKRLLIAMDVAFGMEYLHSRNIVHFDLKTDNLLVNLRDTQRPICKVGDLGLSKVDVFSFGIVMWELLTGEEPYGDLHYGAIIGGIVSNTLRPAVPDNCDPDWRLLMEKCWSAEPLERLSFTEITDELHLMAAKVPTKAQTALSPRTNAHAV